MMLFTDNVKKIKNAAKKAVTLTARINMAFFEVTGTCMICSKIPLSLQLNIVFERRIYTE